MNQLETVSVLSAGTNCGCLKCALVRACAAHPDGADALILAIGSIFGQIVAEADETRRMIATMQLSDAINQAVASHGRRAN